MSQCPLRRPRCDPTLTVPRVTHTGDSADGQDDDDEPVSAPSASAVDYWDITELAEEDARWNTEPGGSDGE